MSAAADDERALVDSNIVVYAHDADEPEKQPVARDLLVRLSAAGHLIFSVQVLNEFSSVMMRPRRPSPMTPDVLLETLKDLANLAEIVPVTASMTFLALDAMTRHSLSFWDALIWAAAKENGISRIYSEDFQNGRDIEGVRIINPLAARPASG
ncbi:MAG TPA: PIN domain-containing protein [Isosphaeraceae bacterium]|jgi:predicted nucleic acid-binding protein